MAVAASTPTFVQQKNGMIGMVKQMTVTLTCDHRHIYGADAAKFLADLAELIETDMESLLYSASLLRAASSAAPPSSRNCTPAPPPRPRARPPGVGLGAQRGGSAVYGTHNSGHTPDISRSHCESGRGECADVRSSASTYNKRRKRR